MFKYAFVINFMTSCLISCGFWTISELTKEFLSNGTKNDPQNKSGAIHTLQKQKLWELASHKEWALSFVILAFIDRY